MHQIFAADTSYYVSTNGNDADAGLESSPFKTFKKAMSVLKPGDSLFIFGGTYTEQLDVTVSGTQSESISIQPIAGQKVTLDGWDGTKREGNTIQILANRSYINISNIEVIRGYECVHLRGSHLRINGLDVHDCEKFGYRINGASITIENSTCHDSVLENEGGTTGSWGSCLKTGPGSANLTIKNNHIYNNWGEGLILGQVAGAKAYNNEVHDNFSQNIYIGNSYDVDVYKNVTYSTNPVYFRNRTPANCISASEEDISPEWGAKLRNIRVFNNVGYSCKFGLGYTYSEVPDNGCDMCIFAHNTMVNTGGIKIIFGTKNHVVISNNILKGGSIIVPTGDIAQTNNFIGDPKFAITPGIVPDSFRLSSVSPVINRGNSISGVLDDYSGALRDSQPDLGAFEYTGIVSQVTSSPTPTVFSTPTPTPIVIIGDANGDLHVNELDYSVFKNNYGIHGTQGASIGDFNSDGMVNGFDYMLWLTHYGM